MNIFLVTKTMMLKKKKKNNNKKPTLNTQTDKEINVPKSIMGVSV